MHNNFYFLKQLSAKLEERIFGYSVVSCFSQNKDELVIELNNTKDSFFIKANLSPTFSCLSFPEEFHRARKNSVDLFREIVLKKIIRVRQFTNERAFALELEEHFSLIFKMHGNFANVLLCKENHVEGIFRNHLQTDFEIEVEKLNKPLDFSRGNFINNVHRFNAVFFTFGKVVFDYLKERNFDHLDEEIKWQLFATTIQYLEKPKYHIVERNGRLIFSLLPVGKILQEFDDPIPAINAFTDKIFRDQFLYNEKREFLHDLSTRLKNSENYVLKNKQKIEELEQDHHYQLWADLIMANLHSIKQGQEKITLNSFYDGKPVEIKLKTDLTPQKNAEVFYRKSKNRQIEINKLKESVSQKEKEMDKLNSLQGLIDEVQDIKNLRQLIEESGLVKKSLAQKESLPYREFEFKAAGLAAFYSKRKNESLCPVAFTQKKFIRKRKSDPAGAVVVEREEVILVEPLAVNR
ncbi:MAG: NFACT family protein [Bacteroidetes bacterium]|nr:NFACT family protein [Bacteroidota bacterium]